MIKNKLAKLTSLFRSIVVVLIAALFVVSIVYAATTIGSSITTEGALTVTGLSTFGAVTSTSVTSTVYLMVGDTPGSFDVFNYAGGDIFAFGDAEIDGNVDIGGYASTTGDLIVSGGTFSLGTGTATTTAGLFIGSTAGTGTTTVGIGDADQAGCLELGREGAWYYCYINGTKDGIVCAAGRCNE